MRRSRGRPLGILWAACAAAPLIAAGCYEIEPQVEKGFVGSRPALPGWPPPAAYHQDPFHPANRLFHRLFVLGADGAPQAGLAPGADVPFPAREAVSAVDRLEIVGLLEQLGKGEEGFESLGAARARAAMQSDLLAFLARYSARADADAELATELGRAVSKLGAGVKSGPPSTAPASTVPASPAPPSTAPASTAPVNPATGAAAVPPDLLPPPLRSDGWSETGAPGQPGFHPSRADLRWTRVYRRPGASVLVRFRIEASADGEPVLSSLGSEAWELRYREGQLDEARLYQLRRTRLVRGQDPWEVLFSGAGAAIRAPGDPAGLALVGKMPALCLACHAAQGGQPAVPQEGPAVLSGPRGGALADPRASAARQLEEARAVLRELPLPR